MANHLARSVSIIGYGCSAMGYVGTSPEILNFSERELLTWSAMEAMQDANCPAKDIDAYYVGASGPNFYAKAKSAAPHYAEWIGMAGKPAVFHDEGCSTSTIGLIEAVKAVASGVYDCVLTSGVGIASSMPVPAYPPYVRVPLDMKTLWEGMYAAVDPCFDKPGSAGVANIEAQVLAYLKKYGYSFRNFEEGMTEYLKIQRSQALSNPKAVLVKRTMEEEAKAVGFDDVDAYLTSDRYNPRMGAVMRSRYLGQGCDGATSLIVCASDIAEKYTSKPIEIAGIASSTFVGKNYIHVPVNSIAACFKNALSMAGISGSDIQYVGLHDCTGGSVMIDTEAIGYMKPGEGLRAMIEHRVAFNGDKPVNTSGGRLQMGHPMGGAVGIEIGEAVLQMRGENGDRQMSNPPKISAVFSTGSGFTNGAVILKNTKG